VRSTPIARGGLVALAAAVLFGVTAPLVKRFGAGVGPFATAAVLYAGAALGAGFPGGRHGERAVGRRELGRVALLALLGAVLAPVALAWGLQHTGAVAASLLLNLEAVFTVVLARAIYREPAGARVAVAVTLMVAGGAVLGLRAGAIGSASGLGLGAVALATLAWALDNTLTRPLSELQPQSVVFAKAALGALLSAALAALLGDSWPVRGALVGLLLCGTVGYGVSLRLYLRAQRALGAARTGSLFALAPFVGATLAFVWGDRSSSALVAVSALLFAGAVYLHLTEDHGHVHVHDALLHEHVHRHDDGHHDHAHDPPVRGSHSHPHQHERTVHGHAHGSDVHHRHRHG